MKFIVSATGTWDPKELVEEYPAIYDYDHEVEKFPAYPNWTKTYMRLDTLAELIEFQNKIHHPIILSKSCTETDMYELEIYGGYRE